MIHEHIASPLMTAALEYAERGWKVFPLRPDQKEPITANGQKDATDDLDTVRGWWTRNPNANIGLHLAPSGLIAVDVDDHQDGCDWSKFRAERGIDEIETLTQRSARGGLHYLYRTNPDDEFPGKACAGVDLKHRGYIVLEPSTFQGNSYQWETDDEPAPVPDWVPRKAKIAAVRSPTETTTMEQTRIIGMLKARENDLTREDWVRLGLALKFEFGDAARGAWLDFSYRFPGAEPNEPERIWDTANPNGAVGLGTVMHLLGDGGDLDMGLSDDELALDLGRIRFDDNAKFVSLWGRWLFWDCTLWRADERLTHFSYVREYLRERARQYIEWADAEAVSMAPEKADKFLAKARETAKGLRSKMRVAAVEALTQSNPTSAASPGDFNTALHLLGTPAGTVNLHTGVLHPANRADLISKSVAVAPAPAGTRPDRWLAFLNRIMDGDAETIAFLQRAAGYALTGETSEHKLLFLYGTGRNGKSVFLETLMGLLGDYAKRAPAETFLQSQNERHPTDIARLDGPRLVIGSELPRGKVWNESVIKDLTGGETMSARYMRQDYFDFKPQLTLMIAGNTQPAIRGVDEAMRARLIMVPFAVTVPENERDAELPAKLKEEWPAILRWCIEGAMQWYRHGLAVPDIVRNASRDYLDGEDIIGQFLTDCTVPLIGHTETSDDLHQVFKAWCESQGLTDWSKHPFIKEIKARGYEDGKTAAGRGVKGLRLIKL